MGRPIGCVLGNDVGWCEGCVDGVDEGCAVGIPVG